MKKILLLLVTLSLLISCKKEDKRTESDNKSFKNLKIEKVEEIKYPCKFGKVDYNDGFISQVTIYDTNGYPINYSSFNRDEVMKKYNCSKTYSYSNDYNHCKIEEYNNENLLIKICVDSFFKGKRIERKIFNKSQILTDLIKYKYNDDNLVEIVMYDSTGKVDNRDLYYYNNSKEIKHIRYDKFDHISDIDITEYSGNLCVLKSYDVDNKLDFQSQFVENNDGLLLNSKSMYIYKEDTTNYKSEYTYQNSTLLDTIKSYHNDELHQVTKVKLYKRKK